MVQVSVNGEIIPELGSVEIPKPIGNLKVDEIELPIYAISIVGNEASFTTQSGVVSVLMDQKEIEQLKEKIK